MIYRGRRADLGNIYFRSRMEANVARWLEWMRNGGQIANWEYEPRRFEFPGEVRGAVCYIPDFRVTELDGTHYWIEVKGREFSRDRTKWKRMAKHHPAEQLRVIRKAEYRDITKLCSEHIPEWE
jgi:hypothetical protein